MPACGLVGLPNVGKSTLFNALTQAKAEVANYPFCTIDPTTGIVPVIDPRLEQLSLISHSKKIVYAPLEIVDIAGLVKGASKGEGLGNEFLTHIRQTDAIVQVVRCFEDSEVVHVEGKVDPISDIETIALELALADLQSVQNILQKLTKQAKGQKEVAAQLPTLEKAQVHLNQGLPLRTLSLTAEEQEQLHLYNFLTAKKIIYVANVAEEDLPSMENPFVEKVRQLALAQGSDVVPICAKLEAELVELPLEQQGAFLEGVGLKESGLHRLSRAAFRLLGLITYLTTGELESRAWTIYEGSSAYVAAGKIHTDIQKRFAKAEVIKYEDFVKFQGRVGAKEAGKALIVGRDYIVKDGDVILFL